jgi:integrase
MAEPTPESAPVLQGDVVPAGADPAASARAPRLTDAGQTALAAAAALARKAAAPATLRAYKADWTHYAAWCASMGFVPVPAEPKTVGAYLASLAGTHAPTTIRRRLSALGKMHRFNDLAWNPAHRDIQGPLQGLLRTEGRPVRKAAALSIAMLRQLVATCDASPRGRRDRALLLFGFAGALRRSELVSLHVEDVAAVGGGLRLRIVRGKTDQVGQGAEIGLPRGKYAETCPVLAFEAWQAIAKRQAGPLFRRISVAGTIGEAALHPDAVRRILAHRTRAAGLTVDGFDRLSTHALRVGFITEAYGKGVRDEDIMRHTRHRDLRTMRGYVQRAGLVSESPAGVLDL